MHSPSRGESDLWLDETTSNTAQEPPPSAPISRDFLKSRSTIGTITDLYNLSLRADSQAVTTPLYALKSIVRYRDLHTPPSWRQQISGEAGATPAPAPHERPDQSSLLPGYPHLDLHSDSEDTLSDLAPSTWCGCLLSAIRLTDSVGWGDDQPWQAQELWNLGAPSSVHTNCSTGLIDPPPQREFPGPIGFIPLRLHLQTIVWLLQTSSKVRNAQPAAPSSPSRPRPTDLCCMSSSIGGTGASLSSLSGPAGNRSRAS